MHRPSANEAQELVVHESEHRAAGLREVLSVLGRRPESVAFIIFSYLFMSFRMSFRMSSCLSKRDT